MAKKTKKEQVPQHKTIADIMTQYRKDVEDARASLPWSVKTSAFPEFTIYGDGVSFCDRGDILDLETARQVLKLLLAELTPTTCNNTDSHAEAKKERKSGK